MRDLAITWVKAIAFEAVTFTLAVAVIVGLLAATVWLVGNPLPAVIVCAGFVIIRDAYKRVRDGR